MLAVARNRHIQRLAGMEPALGQASRLRRAVSGGLGVGLEDQAEALKARSTAL